MGSDQEPSSQERPPRKEPQDFLITFGKALLTAILGLAALLALAATVCGMALSGPQGGRSFAIISAIVLIALVYAIYWLWR